VSVHDDSSGPSDSSARLAGVRAVDRFSPWILRALWVGLVVAGGRAIDSAVDGRSDAVIAVATYGAAGAWVIGVAAMAIPATVSLTATRMLVPMAVGAAMLTATAGAEIGWAIAFFALSVACSAVAGSASIGRRFVGASAYGAEDRHLLRPPAAYLMASMVTWAVWTSATIGGPLFVASQRYIVGVALCALAIAGVVWSWPRFHRLSRRWLVLVPVGLVLHDQLVLGETIMLRRNEIAAIHLAPASTDAADLTGPAAGHAIEIVTHEPVTVITAASPKVPRGTALHLTGCLVAPTRPGEFLAAARACNLPVG
jgi:hypothetical protein